MSEDERDGVGVPVVDEAALQQRVDESRRGGAADLPLRFRASALAQRRAHLLENVVDVGDGEALPLHGVPRRAGAHAERVPLGVDPLVAGPERPERIRILGNLAQHGKEHTPDGLVRRLSDDQLLRRKPRTCSSRGYPQQADLAPAHPSAVTRSSTNRAGRAGAVAG